MEVKIFCTATALVGMEIGIGTFFGASAAAAIVGTATSGSASTFVRNVEELDFEKRTWLGK